MFGKDKKVTAGKDVGGITLIAQGTEVCGDLRFAGNLEIEGKVSGDIIAVEGGKASVRVLEQGQVTGSLRVPNVIINGQVDGDVYSSEFLELASKAKVTGDVHYGLIEMAKGAQVNGSLVYAQASKSTEKKVNLKEVKPVVAQGGE